MVIEVNEVQLNYEIVGDGEPLLWLHGFMGAGADWKYIFNGAPSGVSADRAGSTRPRRVDQSIRPVLISASRG